MVLLIMLKSHKRGKYILIKLYVKYVFDPIYYFCMINECEVDAVHVDELTCCAYVACSFILLANFF